MKAKKGVAKKLIYNKKKIDLNVIALFNNRVL